MATNDLDLGVVNKLLRTGLQNGASDIHFKVGDPPLYRVDGALKELKFPNLEPKQTRAIADMLVTDPNGKAQLDELTEMDCSYQIEEGGRFRVNIYRQQGALAVILRVIPAEIPSFDELRLPAVLRKIAGEDRGLILVTGATGAGKSTTVASILEYINATKKKHILTIEDPVEFIFTNKMSSFSQREVGNDTPSFTDAVRSAMRQDPDVIYVGEMRDLETIDNVLKAAETGHLVISTIHTPDAEKTIGRIVSYFPAGEQAMARVRIAENLGATISQRLLPLKNGKGRIVACEVMIVNKAVQESIRDASKIGKINDFIAKGRETLQSTTFDQYLMQLYNQGSISLDVAKSASANPQDFERNLTFTS